MNTYGAVHVFLYVFLIFAVNWSDGRLDAPKKPRNPVDRGWMCPQQLDAVEEDKVLSVPNTSTLFTVTKGYFGSYVTSSGKMKLLRIWNNYVQESVTQQKHCMCMNCPWCLLASHTGITNRISEQMVIMYTKTVRKN